MRAVNEIEPKVVIFENVAGFKSLYSGAAFETLINELETIGYNVHSSVLDAADYGLPQHRKRTIVVGVLKNYKFQFPTIRYGRIKSLIEKPYLNIMSAISDLPPLKSGDDNKQYLTEPKNDFQKKMRGGSNILTEHNASNYGSKMKKILSLIPKNGSVKDLPMNLRPKNYFNNVYARIDP